MKFKTATVSRTMEEKTTPLSTSYWNYRIFHVAVYTVPSFQLSLLLWGAVLWGSRPTTFSSFHTLTQILLSFSLKFYTCIRFKLHTSWISWLFLETLPLPVSILKVSITNSRIIRHCSHWFLCVFVIFRGVQCIACECRFCWLILKDFFPCSFKATKDQPRLPLPTALSVSSIYTLPSALVLFFSIVFLVM